MVRGDGVDAGDKSGWPKEASKELDGMEEWCPTSRTTVLRAIIPPESVPRRLPLMWIGGTKWIVGEKKRQSHQSQTIALSP